MLLSGDGGDLVVVAVVVDQPSVCQLDRRGDQEVGRRHVTVIAGCGRQQLHLARPAPQRPGHRHRVERCKTRHRVCPRFVRSQEDQLQHHQVTDQRPSGSNLGAEPVRELSVMLERDKATTGIIGVKLRK